MLTKAGTKQPRRVDELAESAHLDESLVRGTLRELESSGVVRLLNEKTDTWEVSHDFIARLLGL